MSNGIADIKQIELDHGDFHKYVWHACETCGKERWVKLVKGLPKNVNCNNCNIRNSHQGSLGILDNNRTHISKYDQALNQKELVHIRKVTVLTHYSVMGILACKNCGETDIDTLCLDHIAGDGNKHRRDNSTKGNNVYNWIIKNKYPDGFQVLCANCNLRKTRIESWRNGNYLTKLNTEDNTNGN